MTILQQHSQTGEYPKYTSSATPDPLEAIKILPQWVSWQGEKVPINPRTRDPGDISIPSTWATYQQAKACEEEHGYAGVEFAFTEDDAFFGIDFDKCRNPETREIHPAVVEILDKLDTYTELSPSGTGVHIIGIGSKPGPRCATDKTPWGGKIEVYDKKRFFTITEEVVGERGLPVRDAQDVLDSVYREFFPEPEKPVQPPVRNGTGHTPALGRELLLHKARNGPHGREFSALYDRGDISGCRNDKSRADLALCKQLAFWTGGDAALMDSLFRQSALYRKKWEREDYRNRTIENAIKCSKRYDPEHKPRVEGSTLTRDKLLEIHQYAVLYKWEENAGNSLKGASDYAAFLVMLEAARKANSLEIDMNGRDLMVAGGFGSRRTAAKAIARLEDTHSFLVKVAEGSSDKSARYRIKDLTPSKVDQALIRERERETVDIEFGPLLSKSVLIRNTSPTSDKEYDKNGRRMGKGGKAPVSSVGKVAGRVLDLIHYYSRITGKPATVELLEERTSVRRDNLKSREIRKLLEAGLVLEVGDGYVTPEDVQERLEQELEDSGCNEKKRIQTAIIAREREIRDIQCMHKAGADYDDIAAETGRTPAEIMAILKAPDTSLTEEEMARRKEWRDIVNADGDVNELEKEDEFGYFPDPESREPRLSSSGKVSKGNLPQEPRESRVSRPEEVSKGNVPQEHESQSLEDEHPLGCDCLGCSAPATRYASPARIKAKDERHGYVSLVT